MCTTFTCFLASLLAFESGWDRARYLSGDITTAQLTSWARGPVESFFPHSNYTTWADLTPTEWERMSYRSMNELGFVGYQFGEAVLIDLGYYQDEEYYMGGGNGTQKENTWDGTWTGKNGVWNLEGFMNKEIQDRAILEAFGMSLWRLEKVLGRKGGSVMGVVGGTRTYPIRISSKTKSPGHAPVNGTVPGIEAVALTPNSPDLRDKSRKTAVLKRDDDGTQVQLVTVSLTVAGILAACHLRGVQGTADLILEEKVSEDEIGTSILNYIHKFGGYETPLVEVLKSNYVPPPEEDDDDGNGDEKGGKGEISAGTRVWGGLRLDEGYEIGLAIWAWCITWSLVMAQILVV